MTASLPSLLRVVALLALTGPRPFCRPAIPPGPAAAQLARQAVRVTVRDSASGQVEVFVRAGYALDPPGFEGLAQATALSIAEQQPSAVVEVDAEWVVFRVPCTTPDCAVQAAQAVADGPSADGLVAAQVLADAQLDPSQRLALADDVATLWLYEAHPYGHLPAGRRGSQTNLTILAAQAFFDRHYVRAAMHVVVDDDATAEAIKAPLESLPRRLPADAPLQRPEPVSAARALIMRTDDPPDTAFAGATFAVPPSAVADVAEALSNMPSTVWVTTLHGAPDDVLPRRQAHVSVRATAKTDYYAVLALQRAIRELRCNPSLEPVLQYPTVAVLSPHPEQLLAQLDEDFPADRVYCTHDSQPAVSVLDLYDVHIIDAQDLFQ